jgi:hypothetical protein
MRRVIVGFFGARWRLEIQNGFKGVADGMRVFETAAS